MMDNYVAYCHHRDAATKVSFYFLSLAVSRVTDLLTTTHLKIHLSNTVFHFFCGPQHYTVLCSTITSNYLSFCTVSRRYTQHHLNAALQTAPALSATLLNFLPLSYAAFPHLNALSVQKCIPRAKFSFFRTSQFSSISLSAYPKCMLTTPMLSKIAKLFDMASTPLAVSLFSLCN